MQEAFEKIIDKLEKQADELYKAYCIGFNSDDRAGYDAYVNAIEIVKQEAEECNNGWVQVSERLPEKYNRVLVRTDKGGYYIAHLNKEQKWVCTAECVSTVIENSNVIAWQPLPAPYNPHICTNNDCTFNDGKDCPAAEGCAGYERKRTNFDVCCESMEAMAQIIEIAKIGWTKDQIIEWLQKEECPVPD